MTTKPPTPEEEAAELSFGKLTPTEARAHLAELRASKEFTEKRFNGQHPGFRLARASLAVLHRQANPE